ncbi:MAG: Gfo/Idh/MocA family oxidoreductase [Spirochaetota bacterium]
MSKPYFTIGFIGGGINSAVGAVHKIASQMDGKFRLVAGCFSKDIKVNRMTGTEWDIDPERVYANWELMIEKENNQIDAIVILTPTPDHTYMIAKALETGLPVISEKALTKSVDDVLYLKQIIDKKNSFLTITYNYTGYPAVRELKERINDDQFGTIHQIMVEMPQEGFIKLGIDGNPIIPQSWRLKDYAIPTISLDLGIHVHNLLRFLINEDVYEVIGIENSFGFFNQIVDDVHAIAKFKNNIICNIWYSKSAIGYRNGLRLRIFGNKGSAEWYQMYPEQLIVNDNNGNQQIISRGNNFASVVNQLRYNRFKAGHPAGFIEAFANLYSDIYESLCTYKQNPRQQYLNKYTFGIDDALSGLIFLESIHRSFIEKRWVKVNE